MPLNCCPMAMPTHAHPMQPNSGQPTAQEHIVDRKEFVLVAQGLERCQLHWGAFCRHSYSEYISNCIPMSRIKPAQGNSHLEDPMFDGERNQSASSLDEPAVTAMVPIIAWSIAI